MEISDMEVVQRIRAGKSYAYEIIMRRYNQRLFRVARSILRNDTAAQDAMQQAYVRAYFNLDQFREPGNFSAWITRITVNEALMEKRKDNRLSYPNPLESGDAAADTNTVMDVGANPEEEVGNVQLRRIIEEAIERLPVTLRSVFMLRAVEQLSVRETAECLNILEATVKTRFHRARNQMQQELNRHIEAAELTVSEFAGSRCNRMVERVLTRIGVRVPTFSNNNLIQ